MPSLREHLDAPQFTDENGESLGESHIGRFGGNWVKQGVPRRRAYLFYGICLFGGTGLILTGGGQFDIFALFGALCLILGVAGGAETIRNKPFTAIFGGPAKPKE
jgi:hypothetical protein